VQGRVAAEGTGASADVVVVGGGPAGAAAAIELARAGRDVVVVDRATFPRDKCCGDGLTAEALRQLEALDLRPSAVPSWQVVDDVWVRSPSGRTIRFPLPRDQGLYAAVARRSDLDAALIDVARAAGAKVHDGHALTDAEDRGDHIDVEIDGIGTVSARFAVGADGMWSPLRKALGHGRAGYLGEWHAFRQYFAGVSPRAADMWVWFEPDLLPGYLWSFPLPGRRANVGFGIRRIAGLPTGHMRELWSDLLERPQLRAVLGDTARPEAPHKAWPIPAAIDRAELTCGRALFVGDAATATDPMTGEGIAQALLTGRLAARAIATSDPERPERATARYETAARNALVADHRMSLALGRVLRHDKGARAALRVAGISEWTRRNFARWLMEDEPRAVALTPRRWHRQFLARDGAYS
jgi:geranylgeranyl reductase family protein